MLLLLLVLCLFIGLLVVNFPIEYFLGENGADEKLALQLFLFVQFPAELVFDAVNGEDGPVVGGDHFLDPLILRLPGPEFVEVEIANMLVHH